MPRRRVGFTADDGDDPDGDDGYDEGEEEEDLEGDDEYDGEEEEWTEADQIFEEAMAGVPEEEHFIPQDEDWELTDEEGQKIDINEFIVASVFVAPPGLSLPDGKGSPEVDEDGFRKRNAESASSDRSGAARRSRKSQGAGTEYAAPWTPVDSARVFPLRVQPAEQDWTELPKLGYCELRTCKPRAFCGAFKSCDHMRSTDVVKGRGRLGRGMNAMAKVKIGDKYFTCLFDTWGFSEPGQYGNG